MLKIHPIGCDTVNPNLPNCADRRGGLFYSNKSTTFSTQGLANGRDGAIYELGTYEENFLDRSGNASYGRDTVSLGLSGSNLPSLNGQIVASLWTDNYFLGSLGLSPYPINFTTFDSPQQSMLSTLRNQSLIPSLSWAYTAGAFYKTPPVFGSLTLGGYDQTRFKPNNLTIAFGADFSRDLLLNLNSISYDTVGSSPLLASGIDVFIDSMIAELWLPAAVCQEFATAFNLTWNEQGQLYLVSSTAHTALLAQNPKFTFTLGQAGGGGPTIDIILPYAAFDLNLTAPVVGNVSQRYFPLKQAQNSSQYTLGRTFLQEAYIIADYERRNFSVSQSLFPGTSVAQQIVAIRSPSDTSDTKSGLSAGAIAGIAVGIIVILLISTALWYIRRRRRAHIPVATEDPDKSGYDFDQQGLAAAEEKSLPPEVYGSQVPYEMHGDQRLPYEADAQDRRLELSALDRPAGLYELDQQPRMYEIGGRELRGHY